MDINNYTIICYETPSSVTLWGGPGEPFVTFIMMHSVVDLVDRFFFRNLDYGARIKEFIAINNTWTAIRGEGLNDFNRAIRVDLSKNKIKDIRDTAFLEMGQMKFLNLSGNYIESFNEKSFKIRYSTLQELDASYNKLRKLGGEFNIIPDLKVLHLQYNYLTNIPDDALKNVKNLTYLNLQHNLLTSVGSSFQGLGNLLTLDLTYNYFKKLTKYDVNGLISLVNLNISHNDLKSVEPSCFSGAKNLKTIDFSFNNIKMIIPENMFVNNSKLRYANFYNNNIVGVRANAFKNCDLHYLNLEKNNINDDLRKILSIAQNNTDLVLIQDKVDIKLELETTAKIKLLQEEARTIHSEIDKLKLTMTNLSVSLRNHGSKIQDLLKYITTGEKKKQ